MKFTISIFALLSLFFTQPAFAQGATEQLLVLEKQAVSVRDLQKKFNNLQMGIQDPDRMSDEPLRRRLATTLIKEFEAINIPLSRKTLASDFFQYYHARLLAMAGQDKEAQKILIVLADSEATAPEALDSLYELDSIAAQPTSIRLRRLYWVTLGRLIPLSAYGDMANSQETELRRLVEERPVIPFTNPGRTDNNLVEVAKHFFEMKMYERAAIAYPEAIYATFPPPRIRIWYWESWFSRITAPLWSRAAEAEWQRGGSTNKMADYMAKAIVFGSDATKDEALKVLAEWRQGGKPNKPPPAEPDPTKLKRIAELYAEMNLHPRAIALLNEFRQVIGPEAQTLRERYEKEWLGLLDRYCYATTKCTLFGQDVSKKENRLKVIIPPPLQKEALDAAAKMIRELSGGVTTPMATP